MRLLLVDDHALFRQGLQFILSALQPDVTFIEADTAFKALNLPLESAPDLILLDLYMPGGNGMDIITQLRERFEQAPIVVLSSEENPQNIRTVIDYGAAGFIPKAATPEMMMAALRLVLAGGVYVPHSALLAAPDIPTSNNGELSHRFEQLSERQLAVVQRAVQGKPNKIIARELSIAEGTVKAHLSAAFRTLGVQNRTEAVYLLTKWSTSSQH